MYSWSFRHSETSSRSSLNSGVGIAQQEARHPTASRHRSATMRKQRSFHQRFGQRAISTRKRSSAEAGSCCAGSGRFGSKLPARRRARLRFNQLRGEQPSRPTKRRRCERTAMTQMLTRVQSRLKHLKRPFVTHGRMGKHPTLACSPCGGWTKSK
jgi:hypothetical protein